MSCTSSRTATQAALRELGAEFAQLLAEEDVGHIAAALEPGHRGRGARVGEHLGGAVRVLDPPLRGGQLVASGRSPCRRSSLPLRRAPRRRKEPDMPLGPGRRGPGVMGGPVARTAVVVGTVAVVSHGVGRRSDRRGRPTGRPPGPPRPLTRGLPA